MMKTKKRKETIIGASSWLRYIHRALIALQAIMAIILGVRLAGMRILPTKYMAAYIIVMTAIIVLTYCAARKKALLPVMAVVAALISGGLVYGFVAVSKLDNTIQKVSIDGGQEIVEMAVVTLAESPAETLEDIGGERIGYIRGGEGVPDVQAVIDTTTDMPVTYDEYSDVLSLAHALLDGTENAIILNSVYIDIISDQDGYEDFLEKVRVVYTLAVEADTKHNADIEKVPLTDPYEESDTKESVQLSSDESSFILYISGIDAFGSVNVKSRSDVNILMVLNMETGHIQLISTPRDYYVTLPDKGATDKLTHAGLYGVECSKHTLENLYGITIDYYLRINFSGFENIIDSLGGVDVYSGYDFTVEPIKHYTVGYNHLSGIEALAFARERYSFAEGDIQRGTNQMEVIKAVIAKAVSVDMIANYSDILNEISDCVQTDMTPEMIYDLVRYQLSNNVTWQVDSFTVKGVGSHKTTYSMPGTTSYVMIPDEAEVNEASRLIEAVLTGE